MYRKGIDFRMLILYSTTYLICVLIVIDFFVKYFRIFSMYKAMSSEIRDNFATSFLNWTSSISFSYLLALARTFRNIVYENVYSACFCLDSHFFLFIAIF